VPNTRLFRPVGQPELDLIEASGWRQFPPRLDWQPIFYPVLTEDYAVRIARDWNTKDDKNGNVGYVTAFDVDSEYLSRHEVHDVGGRELQEYWIPATELEDFNRHIVGSIEVLSEWRGSTSGTGAITRSSAQRRQASSSHTSRSLGSKLGDVEDPYLRLRPMPPTPTDELCSCPGCPPMLLMWAIGPNPMHCLHCNGEIEPAALPLPVDLVDPVAHWAMLDGAIEHLELDSGPYEQWAQRELLDLKSPVNIEGLALRRKLDGIRRCYFVLFQLMDGSGTFVVPPACPQCGGAFQGFKNDRFTRLLCEACGLALVNP
jgi:hypothetical protein